MTKYERDLKQRIERCGVTLIDLHRIGSGHYAALIRRSDGVEKRFFMPSTPSDWRGLLNKAADIKRWGKGQHG